MLRVQLLHQHQWKCYSKTGTIITCYLDNFAIIFGHIQPEIMEISYYARTMVESNPFGSIIGYVVLERGEPSDDNCTVLTMSLQMVSERKHDMLEFDCLGNIIGCVARKELDITRYQYQVVFQILRHYYFKCCRRAEETSHKAVGQRLLQYFQKKRDIT